MNARKRADKTDITRTDLVILGTIHGQHLSCHYYSLGHLKAAFVNANANLLLVEVRPDQLRRGDLADGPFEMTYLAHLAWAKGVVVAGIDWFQSLPREPKVGAETQKRLESELRSQEPPLGHRWPLSYGQSQEMIHLRHFQGLHRIRVRHLGDAGDGDWQRRNLWMAHRVLQELKTYNPKRALLVVGAEHVADLWDLLKDAGAVKCHLLGPVEALPAAEYVADEKTLNAWRHGVAYLEQHLGNTDPETSLYRKLERKIRYWRQAVEQKGIAT